MARTVGIGGQNFEDLIMGGCFYVDKTMFIREWWENKDAVTLITRPRRFGKTLNMSMTETFFSVKYAGRSDLFRDLSIWQDEGYRKLQGSFPVISLSFATVKRADYPSTVTRICQLLTDLYRRNCFLLEGDILSETEKAEYKSVSKDMQEVVAAMAIYKMSEYLSRYYKKKVIILLDEYDTPLEEAYVNGYWGELAGFIRDLFNASFKTNPYLDRALMTGITRISRESVFSDLNNLEVVTTTSVKYQDSFGFTQKEVSQALQEYGLSEKEERVRCWYDGFTFGNRTDIYNPWSILNFLEKRRLATYWANTSNNRLIGTLLQEGSANVKVVMEDLLHGGSFHTQIDEQIVFSQLDENENAIWSFLLAGGYLRIKKYAMDEETGQEDYELTLTNKEIRILFEKMIRGWFQRSSSTYNEFIKALLHGDIKAMNTYMNRVALATFSSFDTGKKPSKEREPERFYHGFVLGLMVDLADRYVITSNRESGFGRYDVLLEPRDRKDDAIILEFKVHDPDDEKTLESTVKAALDQIERKRYSVSMEEKGIAPERIRRYGFAFEGKQVLIGESGPSL